MRRGERSVAGLLHRGHESLRQMVADKP
jgi:hypothetical protein